MRNIPRTEFLLSHANLLSSQCPRLAPSAKLPSPHLGSRAPPRASGDPAGAAGTLLSGMEAPKPNFVLVASSDETRHPSKFCHLIRALASWVVRCRPLVLAFALDLRTDLAEYCTRLLPKPPGKSGHGLSRGVDLKNTMSSPSAREARNVFVTHFLHGQLYRATEVNVQGVMRAS